MQYICEQGHIFTHAAKQTIPLGDERFVSGHAYYQAILETYVCPKCRTIDFKEYVEPQPEITSVKSVDLNEVDTYLKDGYVVEAMFAKTATVVKKEAPKQEQPDPDCQQALTEAAETTQQIADESFPHSKEARAAYEKLEGK